MDEKADELRRHAAHCRRLAQGPTDQRTRAILMTMAAEFEVQANNIEAAGPAVP